jgi:hypothetical protein
VNPYWKKKSPLSSSQKSASSSVAAAARTQSIASSTPEQLQTPVTNPYAKKRTPSSNASPASASPGVVYPTLQATHRMYADIRPNLLLALWKFARSNLVQ